MTLQVFTAKIGRLPKVIFRKLGKEQAWGQLTPDNKFIEVDPRLKGQKLLIIALHEFFHWLFPKLSEDEIIVASEKTAAFLWKIGFRRVDNHEDKKV